MRTQDHSSPLRHEGKDKRFMLRIEFKIVKAWTSVRGILQAKRNSSKKKKCLGLSHAAWNRLGMLTRSIDQDMNTVLQS